MTDDALLISLPRRTIRQLEMLAFYIDATPAQLCRWLIVGMAEEGYSNAMRGLMGAGLPSIDHTNNGSIH